MAETYHRAASRKIGLTGFDTLFGNEQKVTKKTKATAAAF
jgi:hypothetical protein